MCRAAGRRATLACCAAAGVEQLTDGTFHDEVDYSDDLFLVEFYAPWRAPRPTDTDDGAVTRQMPGNGKCLYRPHAFLHKMLLILCIALSTRSWAGTDRAQALRRCAALAPCMSKVLMMLP